jgi:hypothetical protein
MHGRAGTLPVSVNQALRPMLSFAATILHKDGTIVTMEACKLSSKRRVATTACAALPRHGIVG